LITVAGCASPPTFTGNGTGIHMQGGTRSQSLYVRSGWAWSIGPWQGYCNQAVTDDHGRIVGWYVDDSVNYDPGPSTGMPSAPVASGVEWANEANCVQWDHVAYPGQMIVAGIPDKRTSWSFTPWHALNAQEWYPFCGSTRRLGALPRRNAWIVQWNFTWKGCPATPYDLIRSLLRTIVRTGPALILLY
jgi:hypothetical protein